MRKPQHRFWHRRILARSFALHVRRWGRGGQSLIAAALGIGFALLCIRAFDSGVRPTLITIAEARAKNEVSLIVNDVVTETIAAQAIAYDNIILLQKDNSGRITALTSNSSEMNRLRSHIVTEIVRKVDTLDTGILGVPMGNLTGLASLSGRGPVLPVQVQSVLSTDAVFRNDFSAAGINQTYHRVMLDVTVEVKLLIPGGTIETAVLTQVNVAETVIVGEVPNSYLQFEQTK